MVFIVETGAGGRSSNAYTTPGFVTAYLTDAGRVTENGWQTATPGQQEGAIVRATSYLDWKYGRNIRGRKLRPWLPGWIASGSLVLLANPTGAVAETVTVGRSTYRFVSALTGVAGQVLIGATAAESATRLAAAITNDGASGGTNLSQLANPDASASAVGATVTVSARVPGALGNTIRLLTGAPLVVSASAATLTGGVDSGPQARELPRAGLVVDGVELIGVPLAAQWAVAELAPRALIADLMADPAAPAFGVVGLREKVGPIETETRYDPAAAFAAAPLRQFPAVDRIMAPLLAGGGIGGTLRG